MDIVQNEKILINELINIYKENDFIDDLDNTAKSISIKLKTLLNDKGEENGLISKNSIRDLKYFSLVHRIKEPDSLKEKFYRGNLLQENFKTYKFKSGAEVYRQRNDVKKTFRKCDDLIGVKILTDLNEDCKKVISILRSNESYLNDQRITLNKEDLAAQPTIMKNGLEIYKIKGEFNADYSFELQIKSKIVSAWGDMEHSIFYKDYFISPVRETTQATMNHIGKLLYQIDDFLLSVRNANKEFRSNSDVISFLSWFDEKYSQNISKKLGGIGFKIDSISEALYYIKTNNKIKEGQLQFVHFRYKSKQTLYKNYIKIRNRSYDLKIFESIVFSWFWTPSQLKENNIDLRFKFYFEQILDFLADNIKKKLLGLDKKEIKSLITHYFNEILNYHPESTIFLSGKEFIKHYKFMAFVKGELEIMGVKKITDSYSKLDLLFINRRMEGNSEDQIREMKFTADDLESFREIFSRIESSIRIKEKTDFKKEISIIKDIVANLK